MIDSKSSSWALTESLELSGILEKGHLDTTASSSQSMASPLLINATTNGASQTSDAAITRRIRRRRPLRACCCCCVCRVRLRRPRGAAPPVLLVLATATAVLALLADAPRVATAFALFPPEPTPAQELGCSPTLTVLLRGRSGPRPRDRRRGGASPAEFFFDPLGLATVQNFARYREAELKAGRVAMLALLQTMAIPLAKAAAPAVSGLPLEQISRMNGGILANTVTSQDLAKVIGTCFVLESVLTIPEPDR